MQRAQFESILEFFYRSQQEVRDNAALGLSLLCYRGELGPQLAEVRSLLLELALRSERSCSRGLAWLCQRGEAGEDLEAIFAMLLELAVSAAQLGFAFLLAGDLRAVFFVVFSFEAAWDKKEARTGARLASARAGTRPSASPASSTRTGCPGPGGAPDARRCSGLPGTSTRRSARTRAAGWPRSPSAGSSGATCSQPAGCCSRARTMTTRRLR